MTIDSSGVTRKSGHYIPVFGPLPRLLARVAALLGIYAVWHYARTGLTLSHYDAKAHLVVARRIFDSITPGWEQIGAVWLPFPHVLNAIPIQIDLFYRTGAIAIAISVLSYCLAAASIAATILRLTHSPAGAVLGAALFATNPDILYLQSTPMTEPLLFGLVALQIYLLVDWVMNGDPQLPRMVGWVTVLACMTRYEAWPITAAAFAVSAFAWWRRGLPMARVIALHARLTLYPVFAVVAFMVFSRVTVGAWFVTGGFYVPDETLRGQPSIVYEKIVEGLTTLGGERLMQFGRVSIVVCSVVALVRRVQAGLLIPLALFAAAALPFYAYVSGHPFRIRYEIPLIVAAAVSVGLTVGLLRRLAPVAAAIVFVMVMVQRPTFSQSAMITEARRDEETRRGREQVTECLKRRYAGGTIMMSMGALGHYMQELSLAGFAIRDFLHEGNHPMWDSAYTRGPAPLVEWVIVEEFAEGGDSVIKRQRELPLLLDGFARVCSGGNVTLYRRNGAGGAGKAGRKLQD